MEAWERVLLDESFTEDVHYQLGCVTCHGGDGTAADMTVAHDGVVRDPDPTDTCGTCHAQTVADAENSLHVSLQGYLTVLGERSDEQHMPQLMEAYENHCADCHASCGQCHISRPTSAGGGLLSGHTFRGTPPPYSTCTGCHGSRIENEYKGRNEDEEGTRYPADVHYNPGGMHCHDCHSADEMHGATGEYEHRYDGAVLPSCTDAGCHEDVSSSSNEQHSEGHLEAMSCQVCHSITYKNCYSCHVELSDAGTPFFRTDDSQMLFLIGRNPIQSEDRPWEYVPVRHVPIARDSFAFYGDDLLPNFDSRPTWTYATPHNIQRVTPQNSSCEGCHDSDALFLNCDDVAEEERTANAAVIIEGQVWPHPCIDETLYDIPQACVACHPKAVDGDWELVSENVHSLDQPVDPAGDVILCEDCHSEESNFDWSEAGYSAADAAEYIWAEYPPIESTFYPSVENGLWLLGAGLVIAAAVAVPLVLRRNSQ